jgi:hypothetical protein
MRRVNGWLTIFWVVMIPVSYEMGWLNSVIYVSALSLWALVSGHWSAWQAARVEVNQQEEAKKADKQDLVGDVVKALLERTTSNRLARSQLSTDGKASLMGEPKPGITGDEVHRWPRHTVETWIASAPWRSELQFRRAGTFPACSLRQSAPCWTPTPLTRSWPSPDVSTPSVMRCATADSSFSGPRDRRRTRSDLRSRAACHAAERQRRLGSDGAHRSDGLGLLPARVLSS